MSLLSLLAYIPLQARFVEKEGLRVGETFFMGSAKERGPFMVVEMAC